MESFPKLEVVPPESRGNNVDTNQNSKEKHNTGVQAQLNEMKKEVTEFKETFTTKVKELVTDTVEAATVSTQQEMEDMKLGMAQIVNNIPHQIVHMLSQGQLPQVQQNPSVTQIGQSQSNQTTKGNGTYSPANTVKAPSSKQGNIAKAREQRE
eukprot:1621138-Ditylum_brightwellii.AAC.1